MNCNIQITELKFILFVLVYIIKALSHILLKPFVNALHIIKNNISKRNRFQNFLYKFNII